MRVRRQTYMVLGGILLIFILFAGLATAQPPDPTGMEASSAVEPTPTGKGDLVVDLVLESPEQLQALVDAGADIWQVDGLRVRARLPRGLATASAAGGAAVDAVQELAPQPNVSTQTLFGPSGYRRYVDVVARLNELAAQRPDLATVVNVGDSWEKTQGMADRQLWALRVTAAGRGSAVKPQVLYLGEHHAREIASSEIALMLAEYLVTSYGSDPDVTYLVDNREIWVLPMVNPDGHVKVENGFEFWRKNTDTSSGGDGVDLNRNYGYMWGGGLGSSISPFADTYRGPAEFSEPETRSIRDLMQSHSFRAALTLHTAGRQVLWPWGYTKSSAGLDPKLARLGTKMASYGGYTPMQSANLYASNGDTCDWSYGVLGVACFTTEIGSMYDVPWGNPFAQPYTKIPQYWSENKPAAIYLAKVAEDLEQVWGPETTALVVTPDPAGATDAISIHAHVAGLANTDSSVARAEYFVDVAGPGGTGAPVTAADGSFDQWAEDVAGNISAGSLSGGQHVVLIRGQNAAGRWGPLSAAFVTVTTSPGMSPTPTITPTSAATRTASPTGTPAGTATLTATPTWTDTSTPTSTVTRTPSSTSTAPAARTQELVLNGGMENGYTGWTPSGSVLPWIVSQHRSGFFGAMVGTYWASWPQSTDSWLTQRITVPSDTTNAVLSFWYWPWSQDVATKDWQEAVIRDQTGRILGTVLHRAGNEQRWIQVQYDLSPYAGQSIELGFHVHADSDTLRTYMLVDDISVLASTGGAPVTWTPTSTPAETLTWTATASATPTASATETRTPDPTSTPTWTATPTRTVAQAPTMTPTDTATETATPSATSTQTPTVPTASSTPTATTVVPAGPPEIASVFVTNLTRSSARLVWTTDMPSTTQLEWGRSPYFSSRTPLDSQLVTVHQVDLSGLTFYTPYYFRVRSRAADGSEAVSPWYFFMTRL